MSPRPIVDHPGAGLDSTLTGSRAKDVGRRLGPSLRRPVRRVQGRVQLSEYEMGQKEWVGWDTFVEVHIGGACTPLAKGGEVGDRQWASTGESHAMWYTQVTRYGWPGSIS